MLLFALVLFAELGYLSDSARSLVNVRMQYSACIGRGLMVAALNVYMILQELAYCTINDPYMTLTIHLMHPSHHRAVDTCICMTYSL